MPFARPTLMQLDDRLRADVVSRLPGTDPLLSVSYLGALIRAIAGGNHELYGYLQFIALAAFPDTAEGPELQQWATIWGVDRVAATRATGTLTLTGQVQGTVVPAGTVWRSGANVDYRSLAEVTIPVGLTVNVNVEAVLAGAAGNAAVGVTVTTVSPIAGLVSQATVAAALSGGADIESDASLRRRLLQRLRNPPRGGTVEDYVFWSRSAHSDVTRAWARANTPALGQVRVYFMTDDATANGIPDAATVTAVQDYIDARRPVTADVSVVAPTAAALAFQIQNLTPMTQAVQDAVTGELRDLIRRTSEPGGTILVSHIREAISTAAGEEDHVLISPTANVTVQATQITTLGTITFTTV